MGGPVAPPEWQGGLNLTYKLGPGLKDSGELISMEINTQNKVTTTYNVIGVMRGIDEPGNRLLQYVLFILCTVHFNTFIILF